MKHDRFFASFKITVLLLALLAGQAAWADLIDHDMTMQDLADALGITISYVSDLIKGKRKNELQLAKITSFLGLSEADYAEQTDQT